MLPPCHFLLYSSNTIVTLTEETNRSSHSDTKKLDHFIIFNIIVEIEIEIVYFFYSHHMKLTGLEILRPEQLLFYH